MKIYPLNEQAITIEVGESISKHTHDEVMTLRNKIIREPFPGLLEVVTAYTTVTVFYNSELLRDSKLSGTTPSGKVKEYLSSKINDLNPASSSTEEQKIIVPVCYDLEYAPDLEWIASHHHTTIDEIVRRHTHEVYTVFMIGFTPGFPYMGILPKELESPRKQNPRTQVPAGSVGIAGKQTGIYPFATPGGWQIIGRTPWKLFDAASPSPSLLKAGDRVQFTSISKHEYITLSNKP